MIFALLSGMMLCACGSGASGNGGDGQGENANLLPDEVYFLPPDFSRVEVVIEDASYRVQFTCENPSPEQGALMGDLATSPQGILENKNAPVGETAESRFGGSWALWGYLSFNHIHDLRIFRMENGAQNLLLHELSIKLSQRQEASHHANDTLILTGSVESGQLLLTKAEAGTETATQGQGSVDSVENQERQEHSLSGATVTLTYTKAPSSAAAE